MIKEIDHQSIEDSVRRLNNEDQYCAEVNFISPFGEDIPCYLNMTSVKGDFDGYDGFFAMTTDISDRKT